jgi:hypothetical protein
MAVRKLGATQTWLRPLELKVSNVNWCWLNTIVPHYWLALIETSNTMLSAIRTGLARTWQRDRLSAIFCLFSHINVLHSEVRILKWYVFKQSGCISVLAVGGSFSDLNWYILNYFPRFKTIPIFINAEAKCKYVKLNRSWKGMRQNNDVNRITLKYILPSHGTDMRIIWNIVCTEVSKIITLRLVLALIIKHVLITQV